MKGSRSTRGRREHFVVLEGLRGVASLLVVLFHISEILAGGKQEGNLLPHARRLGSLNFQTETLPALGAGR